MSRFDRIGRLLRERREELGLTHEDVHAAIHVPIAHLRALESGNARDMPSPAFMRGFIRSYCALLELAPEPFLYALAEPAPVSSRPLIPGAAEPAPGDHPAWLTDVIAWGTVVGIILLGWVSYTVVFRPFADDPQDRVEAGTIEAEVTDFFPLEFPLEEE
jgi:cytoskeleton protein RodZ